KDAQAPWRGAGGGRRPDARAFRGRSLEGEEPSGEEAAVRGDRSPLQGDSRSSPGAGPADRRVTAPRRRRGADGGRRWTGALHEKGQLTTAARAALSPGRAPHGGFREFLDEEVRRAVDRAGAVPADGRLVLGRRIPLVPREAVLRKAPVHLDHQ